MKHDDDFEDELEREFRRIRKLMKSMLEDLFDDDMFMIDEDVKRRMNKPFSKVYGFSVSIGPDGTPRIHEFGNVRPRRKREYAQVNNEREPLIDIFETKDNKISIIAEVPGVDKKDIDVRATEMYVTIKTNTGSKYRYYKRLRLPKRIDPSSGKATYKNGVLTLEFNILKDDETGKPRKLTIE
ncbi:Hsp20/alpha crystallin family protein [Candidatus Micrarchaeota archaeon]|nr:Hsp20/alpha crystallin family protein [Candidatus Micrarchaeota archaeon]